MAAWATSTGRSATTRPSWRVTTGVVIGAVVFGAIGGLLATRGHAVDVVALASLLLPLLVWQRPHLGPVIIMLSGLLIEQFPLDLVSGSHVMNVPLTNSIPIFTGLSSTHLEPADLLFFSTLLVYLLKSRASRTHWHPRGPLAMAMAGVFGCMILGLAIGVAHHGSVRESLQECRPVVYMISAYLITACMIRTRSAIHAMLWALTAAEAFKSVQGVIVWIATRNFKPEPQNILGHEESMMFTLFLLMVTALWIYGLKSRLRAVSTSLVPLVLFTDVINDRRVAYLILGAGLAVLGLVAYQALPWRRPLLFKIAGVIALVLAIYLPAFWNDTSGTLGKPATAISSQFGKADPRDALSDDYRIQEDANLELNIKAGKLLGLGYGRQIDYSLPMPGLVVGVDASILYIPHNGVLYEMMRLGILGGVAFWMLLAAGIISGSRLARAPDPQLAAIGAIAAALTVGWAFMAAEDMGFDFDRVMIVMGCVLGLTEAARHIQLSTLRHDRIRARRQPLLTPELVAAGEA